MVHSWRKFISSRRVHQSVSEAWRPLANLLAGRRVVVLSGAGCSTESGIPDYRGEGTRRRARTPVQYKQFLRQPEARRRYWARSLIGWPRFSVARSNPAHQALAQLEAHGRVSGVITQNVDGLHQAAGSRNVIELHGALSEVVCMDCQAVEARSRLQERLLDLNPGWQNRCASMAPDGDADLEGPEVEAFRVADCQVCGGALKPNVVFFGESVPRFKSDAAWALWSEAEVLLVVGSSLTVLSGYRFVKKAPDRGLPVAIVNQGPTRGDEHALLRLDARLGEVLPAVTGALIEAPV